MCGPGMQGKGGAGTGRVVDSRFLGRGEKARVPGSGTFLLHTRAKEKIETTGFVFDTKSTGHSPTPC